MGYALLLCLTFWNCMLRREHNKLLKEEVALLKRTPGDVADSVNARYWLINKAEALRQSQNDSIK